MNPELIIILEMMCSCVGVYLKDVDTAKHDWYRDYSWTKEEERCFIEVLAEHLYTDKEARLMFSMCWKTKKACYHCAEMFVWNYGWVNN